MKLKFPHLPYRDDIFFGLIILLVLVIPLAFFMGTYEKFDTTKLALWYVIAGSAGLALMFCRPPQPFEKKKFLSHPLLLWLLLLLVILGLVSALAGGDYINSFFGYVPRLNQSVILFTLWSATVLLVLARLTRDRLEFLLKVLVFGGLAASLVAIIQCLGWGIYLGPQAPGVVFQRAPGLLGNPDFSALFLAALAPLVVWLFMQASSRAAKIYYGVTFFVVVGAVLALGSRGAWLGLFAEMILMLAAAAVFRLGRKIMVVLAIGLVASAGLWYVLARPSQTDLAGRNLSITETNVNLRFAVWNIAEQAIIDHPWLGVGPGNFPVYFESNRTSLLGNQNGVYDDAHNWFLQIGATVGLPFLLVNLILIITAAVFGFVRFRRHRDILALALTVSLIGFCLMAAFTPLSVGCYFLLALLLGSLFYFDAREVQIKFFAVVRWLAGLLAAAAIVWGVVFMSSELIFYRAYALYFDGAYQESLNLVNLTMRLNKTNRLYYIYRTGDEMRLGGTNQQISDAVNQFVALHPKDADTYAVASTIYFLRYLDVTHSQTDLNSAVDFLGRSLILDKTRASRNIQMAVYLFTDNKLADALNYDIYGLSLDKTSIPGWLLQARLLQMKGDRADTLWALKQATLQQPGSQLLQGLYAAEQAQKDITKLLVPVGYQESTLE